MSRWAKPEFSKKAVNRAGAILADVHSDGPEFEHALTVINNFRSIHNHPLNTFQTTLRIKGRQIDPNILVAQRIKRLSSIYYKLVRFPTMTLSQMQDIGGCRGIVATVDDVHDLVQSYLNSSIKHKLHTLDDYILSPKLTGYRGVHLIYNYYSDKIPTYNSLKIEMQLRSQFQHAWATAVEIVGIFTRQALKSSQGEQEWLRFFSLMGSAIALLEGTALVPGTPGTSDQLLDELLQLAHNLDAVNRLRAYGTAPDILEDPATKGQDFFLLELDMAENKLSVKGYKTGDIERASSEYLEAEKRLSDTGDAVLVSVDSIAALRRAYPNYYLDTDVFVQLVEDVLHGAI